MSKKAAFALSLFIGGLLALCFSVAASAAPIAVTEYGDTTVVLTDNVDESICPLGTHIAIAKAGQQTIIGCWTVDERDVKILWLAPHVLPKSVFEAVEPDTKA